MLAVVDPAVSVVFPASHARHSSAEAAEGVELYRPTSHSTHESEDSVEYDPRTQSTHVPAEVAPVSELAFPPSQATQASAEMEEVAELYLPASQSLQISGPSKSLYFPAGQGSQSVVAPTDPLPNPHDAHGSKNAVLMSDSPVATVKPALS